MFLFRVLDALGRQRVRYALAGGWAVNFHKVVRMTVDIDLVVAVSKRAYAGVERAMAELGLKSKLPVDAADVFAFRKEYIRKKNLKAWSFYNPANPMEIVDIMILYDLKDVDVETLQLHGRKINIISKRELIKMKTGTGRAKDEADIDALRRLI